MKLRPFTLLKIGVLIVALAAASHVRAQSVPNGTIIQGQVWTPAQWNAAWQTKADFNNLATTGGFVTPNLSTSVAPSSQCNWNSIIGAFNCDTSHMGVGIGLQTSGNAQGTPSGGGPGVNYTITRGLATFASYRYCSDCWNADTADNGGRTGALSIESKVDNYSPNGGDIFAFHCTAGVFVSKSAATNFLASDAASCMGGTVSAFTNNVYLQPIGDVNCTDQGAFDIACIGVTMNFKRNVATGNLNQNWIYLNAQSAGSLPMDAEERFYGPTRFSFDLTNQSFPDQTLASFPVLVSGGSSYVACTVTGGICSGGSVLTVQGGTCDQPTTIGVTGVSGGVITTFGIERAGLCATPPGNPVSVVDSKGGTGATFNLTYTGNAHPYMVTPPDTYWYANGVNDVSIWNTKFPSTTLPNTTYHGYSSSLGGWNTVVNNTSVFQATQTQVTTPVLHVFTKGLSSTGGTIQLNVSSNFATNIGTGTTTSAVTIGGTANVTNHGGPLNLTTAGALSANSWTTSGLALSGSAQTLTDTTGSGTITTEAAAALPQYTIATTAAGVTISSLDELFLPAPVAGTNVTATNLYSLHLGGNGKIVGRLDGFGGAAISGAAISLNQSSNFNTTINTGTSTGTIQIGNATNTGLTSLLGISTGTNADFLCLSSGGVVLLQSSACTISSMRFKNHVSHFTGDPLAELDALEVDSYQMNDDHNRDPNATLPQIGLIAENVAKVEPKCAVWENDLVTPKSYRPECITALLVSASQEFHRKSTHQFELIYGLIAVLVLLMLHNAHLHIHVRRLRAQQ